MANGWVSLHRQLVGHDLWIAEKFTRGQAWVDLLMLANFKDGMILVRGIDVPIKRGQVGWSEVRLAGRWKWSRNKVRRYIDSLRKRKMVEHQTDNKTSIITILNYDQYQPMKTPDETPSEAASETPDGQQTDTNNKDKKDKKEKKKDRRGGKVSLDKKEKCDSVVEQAEEVLAYLNEKTGKRFKAVGMIPARLRAGATVEECKQVINIKLADMNFDRKYLDHTTLFREANFDKYLNQCMAQAIPKDGGIQNGASSTKGWEPDPKNRWARGSK